MSNRGDRGTVKVRHGGFKRQSKQQQFPPVGVHYSRADRLVDVATSKSFASMVGGVALAIAVTAALAIGYGVWIGNVQSDVNALQTMGDEQAVRTIFVNAGTGLDTNTGLSSAQALLTISRAIAVMGQRDALECIIQLEGTTDFDLGANPVLCFNPIQRTCKHITVQGTETTLVAADTVQVITDIAPAARNWRRIEGAGTGYPSLVQQYVRNHNQDRVYMIEASGVNTIDTIVGPTTAGSIIAPIPPVPVFSDPWALGDTFSAFSISNLITWTGTFSLDISYNEVTFASLILRGATDSVLRAPGGGGHQIIFKGCQLDAQSDDDFNSSYDGSILLQGVLSQGIKANAVFAGFQSEGCMRVESAWFQDVRVRYGGRCAAFWLNSVNSPADGIFFQGANVVLIGIQIIEPVGRALDIGGASKVLLVNADITQTTGTAMDAIIVAGESTAFMGGFAIVCSGPSCVIGIRTRHGGRTEILGSPALISSISAATSLLITDGGFLDIELDPLLIGFTGTPIVCGPGSYVTINPLLSFTVIAAAFPVISCDACTLNMVGSVAAYGWATSSGPLIVATNGALVRGRFTGGPLVNGGAGAPDVLLCGGNAVSIWAVAENDLALAAGTTQGCICSR